MPVGTDPTVLTPTIIITGKSVSPASGAAQDFSNPAGVIYTVTAADNSTKAYTVKVAVATESSKAITSFTIPSQVGSTTINETAHTIALTMPFGTNVTALVPTITITGASISPLSGAANNFTTPQTYTVTAADASTQHYVVTVSIAAAPTTTTTTDGGGGGGGGGGGTTSTTTSAPVTTTTTSVPVTTTTTSVKPVPGCVSVTPAAADAGDTVDVTIALENIDLTGVSDVTVTFGCTGVTVNSATVNSATEITANITVAATAQGGTCGVTITGASDVGIVCANAFTVNQPVTCLINVSPSPIRSGLFLPRIRIITLTGVGSNWTTDSTVKITGINTIIPLLRNTNGKEIRVLAFIPSKLRLPAGNKTVTVTTGKEICTGKLVIE